MFNGGLLPGCELYCPNPELLAGNSGVGYDQLLCLSLAGVPWKFRAFEPRNSDAEAINGLVVSGLVFVVGWLA